MYETEEERDRRTDGAHRPIFFYIPTHVPLLYNFIFPRVVGSKCPKLLRSRSSSFTRALWFIQERALGSDRFGYLEQIDCQTFRATTRFILLATIGTSTRVLTAPTFVLQICRIFVQEVHLECRFFGDSTQVFPTVLFR